MSDEELIARFKRHQEEGVADSEHAFAIRSLKKICKEFQIEPPLLWSDPELGFGWFNSNYPNFPVRLESRRVIIDDINPMLVSLTRSSAWKVYKEILQMYDFESCGVIVSARHLSLWILHNAWYLEPVPGYTRLSCRARSKDEGLIFEPLPAFILSVKERWAP